MQLSRFVPRLLPAVVMVLADLAMCQDFPNRPVRIVTSEAGGGSDFAARLIAQAVTDGLGQQVVVDNRGSFAPEGVAKSPADGYSLLAFSSPLWLSPLMRDSVPWDPVKDFSSVTLVASSPSILVAYPTLPVKSVKELIALAKAKPGALNYASAQPGSTGHLSAELFKAMTGANIVRIPYKGNGPAMTGLLGGQVDLMFAPSGAAAAHVKSGKLNALAVTSAQPFALAPGLPTVAASGLPGYESISIIGLFAPAKTPAAIINRLNQEVVRALTRADVKERFLGGGVEAVGSTPEQLAASIKSEMTKWGKVIKDAGIREE